MERIISEQDRIRRAEEIANRRREMISIRSINMGSQKRKMPLLLKVFIQTIASICIFGIAYYLSQHNNPVIENVKTVLNYNINVEEIYNKGNNIVTSLMQYIKEEKEEKDQTNQIENNIESLEEKENLVKEDNIGPEENKQDGVGGTDEKVNLSQDEQDILYIKDKMTLIVPTNGEITSKYGTREPTDIISANHAGLDIGATEGTEIKAAMEGTVELVSEFGDYGKHVKITNGEISTLYAHCSNIFVNQGDYVAQGQKIAEVGNTGRTTGPHLHFEIRRNDRTIDPQAILNI